MNYYRILELVDMIDSGLVTPSQYIKWADEIVLSEDYPDICILELCVATSPQRAIKILHSTLGQMDIPLTDSEEYYSWEQENYYIGFLYLKTKYKNISLNEFFKEAGFYSDGMQTNWDCEKFFSLLEEKDDNLKRELFLNEWSEYISGAEKIYLSFDFDEKVV